MTKEEILREALTRLYIIQQSKTRLSHKTREEEFMESIVREFANIPADKTIDVDLDLIQQPNIFDALATRL